MAQTLAGAERAPTYDEPGVTSNSAVPSTTSHSWTRNLSKNRITLKLNGVQTAPSPNAPPVITDLSNLSGSVDAQITNGKIKAVNIKISGVRVVPSIDEPGSGGRIPFLEQSMVAWPKFSLGGSSSQVLDRGIHSWAFSMALPTTVSDPGSGIDYPLPPTFSHKGFPQYLQYSIEVSVIKKGFFSSDESFTINFRYIPGTRASSPSQLRRAAYTDGTPIVGPEIDPEGYEHSSNKGLSATLFSTRQAELGCTLALASPTQYPRGYPLPLFLTVTSDDTQLLDLLTNNRSIVISLKRIFILGLDISRVKWEKQDPIEDIVADARCWMPRKGVIEGRSRTLQGEMLVPGELLPSFEFPRITLKYAIIVTIEGAGVVLNKQPKEIISVPVTITLHCAEGPTPKSYAPAPGYGEKLGEAREVGSGPKMGSISFISGTG